MGERFGVLWRTMGVAAVMLAVGGGTTAATDPAYVVRDLTTGTEAGVSSYPGPFYDLGGTILFFASDDAHGRELWRTDGRGAPVLVKDVAPGPDDGIATTGHALGDGVLYFRAATDGLWRSDGTAAGTFRISAIHPHRLLAAGDRLYAAVELDHDGFTLMRIDLPGGDGTVLGEFRDGFVEPSLTLVDGRLFFAVSGPEGLWTSDGTPEGTRLLRAVELANRVGGNDNSELIAVGGQLFFAARDEAGWELWRSDGTEAGTRRVRDIAPGPAGSIHLNDYWEGVQPFFAALGDRLVFMANDGVGGLEPWRSDGTEAGTVRIADVAPGPRGVDGTSGGADDSDAAQSAIRLVELDGRLYFTARPSGEALELWVTDGTAAGTAAVAPLSSGYVTVASLAADASRLFVSTYDQLFVSDGTAAGTVPILTMDTATDLTPTADGIVFAGHTYRSGVEPWISDGSAAGTRELADLARGTPGLDPQQLTALGNILLFTADDSTRGRELWRSDGSQDGSRLVADIAAGAASSHPTGLIVSGSTLYFVATDGSGHDLWTSDGTAAGTRRVGIDATSPPSLFESMAADGRGGVYFFSDQPVRASIWHSDGTATGTRLLVAGDSAGSYPITTLPLQIGAVAVFTAGDITTGGGIWRTDGTPAGTGLVTGGPQSHPLGFVSLGDQALFFAHGRGSDLELWRTDGTTGGTAFLANVGETAGAPVVSGDGRVLFNAGSHHAYRLWQSDGTVAGTFAIDGGQRSTPVQVAAVGGRIFVLRGRANRTVFAEVGCAALLETVGAFSSLASLTSVGDRLLFSELARAGDQRLWGSDGTAAGTRAVAELPPPSRDPQTNEATTFVRAGQRVYFAARLGDAGRELWALPASALPSLDPRPCEPPPTPTPVPGRPTPGPFDCPAGPTCTVLELEPVEGRAGERATITAVLHASDLPIAGVQNDIAFPPGIALLMNEDGDPDCVVEPSIDKAGTAFSFQPPSCTPGVDCSAMRALVLSFSDVAPIYDGAVLYRCTALLSRDLEPGDHGLTLSNLGASDPDGLAVQLDGIDGVVSVEDQSGTRPIDATAGDTGGCQTAPATGSAMWLLVPAIALLLRRRSAGSAGGSPAAGKRWNARPRSGGEVGCDRFPAAGEPPALPAIRRRRG